MSSANGVSLSLATQTQLVGTTVVVASTRLVRVVRLLDVLQSGQRSNASQLAATVDVSRRTIFRDLALIQEAGLTVMFDSQRQAYFMPSRISVPKPELSAEEAVSLKLLCQQLGDRTKGIPFLHAAQSAADKLLQALPEKIRCLANQTAETVELHVLQPLVNRDGYEWYRLLIESLENRRHVRLEYESAVETRLVHSLVSPYRLAFIHSQWVVVGRSSYHRGVRVFDVARIRQLTLLDSTYHIPPRFHSARYLNRNSQRSSGESASLVSPVSENR